MLNKKSNAGILVSQVQPEKLVYSKNLSLLVF